MRNCPFCKKPIDKEWAYIHYNALVGKWIFDHNCNEEKPTTNICMTVYGDSEQEVIDKWNGVYEEQESESL